MISMPQELTFRTAVATSSQEVSDPRYGNTSDPAGYDQKVVSPNLTATKRSVEQQAFVSMSYEEIVYSVRAGWLIAGFVLTY